MTKQPLLYARLQLPFSQVETLNWLSINSSGYKLVRYQSSVCLVTITTITTTKIHYRVVLDAVAEASGEDIGSP